ncbi:MAG: hypothetical protein GY715_03420 [Planctomycetes bacterium]|nr:hypothetical protein [Planctomycetota bacterium]
MASEAQRGLRRIVANYLRLVATLSLGIVLLPYLNDWLGLAAFGLISLVASAGGLAGMFRELSNQSMVRELGAAHHSGDEDDFLAIYNSAFVVSFGAAAVTALTFTGLAFLIGLLNVPPEWVAPARWMVAALGAYSCLLVLVSPAFAMFIAQERFVWFNFWTAAIRASYLAAALILAAGVGLGDDVPAALIAYGLLSSGLLCTMLLAAVVTVIVLDRRLVPKPRLIRRAAVRRVLHTFGWNSGVHIAMILYERLAMLIMNLAFGVVGNAVFEIAHRLVSYVRMLSSGVTVGLDAVSARVSTAAETLPLPELLRHSTRVQAVVAIPAGLGVFVLAEPLLRLWIGRHVENPEVTIPLAVTIAQILTFALTARSIADSWMFIMYGAGHVRRYAPLVLTGGILSPLVGGALLFALPDPVRYNAPAIGYAVVYTVVHFLMLPVIGARCLDVRYRDLFVPLLRPALATALCSPLLIAAQGVYQDSWTLPRIVAVALVFGALYAVATWFIVLDRAERRRFAGAARRRLPGAAARYDGARGVRK